MPSGRRSRVKVLGSLYDASRNHPRSSTASTISCVVVFLFTTPLLITFLFSLFAQNNITHPKMFTVEYKNVTFPARNLRANCSSRGCCSPVSKFKSAKVQCSELQRFLVRAQLVGYSYARDIYRGKPVARGVQCGLADLDYVKVSGAKEGQ